MRLLKEQTAPPRGSGGDGLGGGLHRAAGGLVAAGGIRAYDAHARGLTQRCSRQAPRLAGGRVPAANMTAGLLLLYHLRPGVTAAGGPRRP
ncbi:hypothetical protein [Streptomyces tremellae]|uniref:Uncharacterized protein n=1 Tax=Streptomyces tremellae TaxID=1124239 RepID=A0ABP7F0S6_9ACTN